MATKIEAFTDEEEHPSTLKKSRSSQVGISYANDGSRFAKIAYSPYFENTTMGIIVCNALWIGIDTEWNHESLKVDGKDPLAPASTVIENLFCVYFTVELIVRFFAFREKRQCFFDAWFVFDSILVGCMIFETWFMVIVTAIMNSDSGAGVGPLSALRLLRLLRLARMGRLMRFVPELGKLVKGMVKAAKSVVFILIFLIGVMYIFCIIFTGTFADRTDYPLTPYCADEDERNVTNSEGCLGEGEFGETGRDMFATMGDSFMSLFTRGVLGDNLDETVDWILAEKPDGFEGDSHFMSVIMMWVFFLFLAITFATLLNMLIGVIVEVIQDAAKEEQSSSNKSRLRATIEAAFGEIDLNSDGLVSQKEWHKVKDNEDVRQTLVDIGLEKERMEERLDQMESMLFTATTHVEEGEEDNTIGFTVDELTERVVEMRPDADASALDLSLMQALVNKDQDLFKKRLKKMKSQLKKFLAEQEAAKEKTRQSKINRLNANP